MTGHPSPVDRTSYLGRRDARSIERDSASFPSWLTLIRCMLPRYPSVLLQTPLFTSRSIDRIGLYHHGPLPGGMS